jgi:murein lipoprotein
VWLKTRFTSRLFFVYFSGCEGGRMMARNGRVMQTIAQSVLIAGVVGLSACATTGDLDALSKKVDAASAEASAARSEASAARAEAAEAKTMAASATATANEAKATSQDTETKIDRMFKKAMHK